MGGLGPEHGVLVGVGHVRPLVLGENGPNLPLIPAVDVQLLEVVIGGRIRGLLLACVGDEHGLWPVVTTEEYKPLPVLTCRGSIPPSASVGPLSSTWFEW